MPMPIEAAENRLAAIVAEAKITRQIAGRELVTILLQHPQLIARVQANGLNLSTAEAGNVPVEKHDPFSLADRVLEACLRPAASLRCGPLPAEHKKIGAELAPRMRAAQRFIVDDDTIATAALLGMQHPQVLQQMLPQARLPFRSAWIEWDNHAHARAVGNEVQVDAARRVGALIEQLDPKRPFYRMTMLQEAFAHDSVQGLIITVSPVAIAYDLTGRPVEQGVDGAQLRLMHMLQETAYGLRLRILGAAYDNARFIESAEDRQHLHDACETLAGHAGFVIAPHIEPFANAIERAASKERLAQLTALFSASIDEQSGAWRVVIALLALLNSPQYATATTKPRASGSRSVGGKQLPSLQHKTLRLRMPREVVYRHVLGQFTLANPRREHDVTGHWRRLYRPGHEDCNHAFVEETSTRLCCALCGSRLTWVRDHIRGSSAAGVIKKDRSLES